MEEVTTKQPNAGQGLGIAGLVLGIIALIISFIPCFGWYAIVPGAIAIVLSAIAFSQAKKEEAAKGLVTAALIISIVATAIASAQIIFFSGVTNIAKDKIEQIDKWSKEQIDDEKSVKKLEKALDKLEEKMDTAHVKAHEAIKSAKKELKEAKEEMDEAAETVED